MYLKSIFKVFLKSLNMQLSKQQLNIKQRNQFQSELTH